jgi:hypothetical protein
MVESLYQTVASRGRDSLFYWLRTHKESRVLGVLSSSAADGARGYPAAVVGSVDSGGRVAFSRRTCSAISSAAARALEAGAAFLWLPVRLQRSGYEDHSNAILILVDRRKSFLFEPHGADASNPGQTAGFKGYYDSPAYFNSVRDLLQEALPGFSFEAPDSFMPSVFGQSVAVDTFCVAWTLMFLRGASLEGPGRWVTRMAARSVEELRKDVRDAIEDLASEHQTLFRRLF